MCRFRLNIKPTCSIKQIHVGKSILNQTNTQTHKDTPNKVEFSVQAPIKCYRLDLENMMILHDNRKSLLKWDFIFIVQPSALVKLKYCTHWVNKHKHKQTQAQTNTSIQMTREVHNTHLVSWILIFFFKCKIKATGVIITQTVHGKHRNTLKTDFLVQLWLAVDIFGGEDQWFSNCFPSRTPKLTQTKPQNRGSGFVPGSPKTFSFR